MTIDWANPAELGTAIAVGAGVLTGGLFLFRRVFAADKIKRDPIVPLPLKQYKRILVPTGVGMCHDDYVTEAASLACHLAGKKGSSPTEVVFTYVIPVPRALPLNADMPQEEAEADRVLNAAADLARKRGLTKIVKQLRKGRTVEDETIKAVEQESADLVILTPQTHAAAQTAMPLASNANATTVPATQAAVHAIHAGIGAGGTSCSVANKSRCYAELDTMQTSDESETVTGKLLRRLPCEAMVARQASTTTTSMPVAFSRN
ncbi:MAG: universal stress protein [Akkermansiaceae bacterium]|nr:universal stress protein [Armatimonadota bacterium]